MKRLIKASSYDSWKLNPPEGWGEYDERYDDLHIEEKWFEKAIEYWKTAFRQYPDLTGEEINDLLEGTDQNNYYEYTFYETEFPEYDVEITVDNTNIYIKANGYFTDDVYDNYDIYRYTVYQTSRMKVKYSIEQFMNKSVDNIIDDLEQSEEWDTE